MHKPHKTAIILKPQVSIELLRSSYRIILITMIMVANRVDKVSRKKMTETVKEAYYSRCIERPAVDSHL